MNWTADFTNDPHRNFELCLTLNEGEDHGVAQLGRSDSGEVVLTVGGPSVVIPLEWLEELADELARDTAHLFGSQRGSDMALWTAERSADSGRDREVSLRNPGGRTVAHVRKSDAGGTELAVLPLVGSVSIPCSWLFEVAAEVRRGVGLSTTSE